jgi:hypothetical protein
LSIRDLDWRFGLGIDDLNFDLPIGSIPDFDSPIVKSPVTTCQSPIVEIVNPESSMSTIVNPEIDNRVIVNS